jgi:hypothetical protein
MGVGPMADPAYYDLYMAANAMSGVPGFKLEMAAGRIVFLARTPDGARAIAGRIVDSTSMMRGDRSDFALILNELKLSVADLMRDQYGHIAIEALFANALDDEKLEMLACLEQSRQSVPSMHMMGGSVPHSIVSVVPAVCCHKQGSFTMQSIMDVSLSGSVASALARLLSPFAKEIITNNSGHYVVLRFLQRYGAPYTNWIYDAMRRNAQEFSSDHYGLRVMKAGLDGRPKVVIRTSLTSGERMSTSDGTDASPKRSASGADDSEDADKLVGEVYAALIRLAPTLCENQYGNYMIQHIFDVAPRAVSDALKEKLMGRWVRYCKQKFSSNVVEKCLKHSQREYMAMVSEAGGGDVDISKSWMHVIIDELLSQAGELIADKYGNYCLQTALHCAAMDTTLTRRFLGACTPHLPTLRENVRQKWQKLLYNAEQQCRQATAAASGSATYHGYPPPMSGGGMAPPPHGYGAGVGSLPMSYSASTGMPVHGMVRRGHRAVPHQPPGGGPPVRSAFGGHAGYPPPPHRY